MSMIHPADDVRRLRGLAIAKHARIKKISDRHWVVPSATHKGTYVVDVESSSCTCPDHEETRRKCKHQWALAYARHEVVEAVEGTAVEETLSITYRQDWPAYNAAQRTEKEHFLVLLKSLCAGIVQPEGKKRGRPRLPMSDVIYSATAKTFTGLSGRRASTDIRDCATKGHIDQAPHYNSIFSYLERPELTSVLVSLVEESASPLASIEKKNGAQFAADSTSFSTSTYYRWFDQKYGREQAEKRWIKLHAMVGTYTNVITAVRAEITNSGDSPELPALLATTAKRFEVAEVSADKAYLSHANLAAIEAAGAVPYIPFKLNSNGGGSGAWERMWAVFTLKQDEFARHYHRRSNVETTFAMVKKKFGPAVRAKSDHAQVNEVLCKALCHNLSALVHAFHEFHIEPSFWLPKADQ